MIPMYIVPQNGAWNFLYQSIEAHPSLPVTVIINPNSGPGAAAGKWPDKDWITSISKLNGYNNTQLLGYVHTLEASRDFNAAAGDIEAYASWVNYKNADIHMDGIFFDEAPWMDTPQNLTYIQNITDYARSKIPNAYTTLNPGIVIPEEFYAMCDSVVAMEDYYRSFTSSALSDIPQDLRNRSVIMLHDFTGDSSEQAQVVQMITQDGIPGLYMTTKADYHSGSKTWKDFSAAMAGDYSDGSTQSSTALSLLTRSRTRTTTTPTTLSSISSLPLLSLPFILATVASLVL